MTIGEALTARAAFLTMKGKLAKAGIDTSDIKSITDLPGALSSIVPDHLAEKAQAILENPEALEGLMAAFSAVAGSGAMAHFFHVPSDSVREGDLE